MRNLKPSYSKKNIINTLLNTKLKFLDRRTISSTTFSNSLKSICMVKFIYCIFQEK